MSVYGTSYAGRNAPQQTGWSIDFVSGAQEGAGAGKCQMGDGRMLFRPVVGSASTGSAFNGCHRHFPELLEAVKRGVLVARALPVELPTILLGEGFFSPTSMSFRNPFSMDTEEMIRAQPMNAVVSLGGCDKTVPARLRAAVAANVPAIQLIGGPMMTDRHLEVRLGACTVSRRFWHRFRAGALDRRAIGTIEGRFAPAAGTCPIMGTASTMARVAEASGLTLPGIAAIPAAHADRLPAAEATGHAAFRLI